MKNIKKLTVALISAMMISSSFAGCSDEEYEDVSSDIKSQIEADFDARAEQYADAQPIQVEYSVDESGHPPMRSVADIKLIPMTKYNGQKLSEDSYLFRNMLSDDDKKVYDLMRASVLHGKKKLFLTVPLSRHDVNEIFSAVIRDCGDVFWTEPAVCFDVSPKNQDLVTVVSFIYNKEFIDDFKNSEAKLEEATQNVLAAMQSMDKDIDKVKYAHDYMIANIDYIKNSGHDQTAYDALVNKKCVCAGYARGFQYLMQKSGIPCAYVVSDTHAWNILMLDGEYYEMDVCWDDLNMSDEDIKTRCDEYGLEGKNREDYITQCRFRYKYFNITEAEITSEFREDKKGQSHNKQPSSDRLPDAVATKYNFDNYYGGKIENHGSDFEKYADIKLPERIDVPENAESAWWEEGENQWWNKLTYNTAKSDWEEIKPGVYKYDEKFKSGNIYHYYYWMEKDEYYMIWNDYKYLYSVNPETGSNSWLTHDYTTYVHPSQIPAETTTVVTTEETKPAETTVITTEETKPAETTVITTEQTKPAETTVITTEETKPAETTAVTTEVTKPAETTVVTTEETKPAETTAPQDTKGWWNRLDSSWKESDWTKVNNDLFKIYDAYYMTTYYWKPSTKTYYATFDGYDACYKVDAQTGDWIEADISEIGIETSGGNSPVQTTQATTTEDLYNWDDDYNNDYNDDTDDYYDDYNDDSYDWLW